MVLLHQHNRDAFGGDRQPCKKAGRQVERQAVKLAIRTVRQTLTRGTLQRKGKPAMIKPKVPKHYYRHERKVKVRGSGAGM